MRNNSPAARDKFAGPGRDLFLIAGCPDAAVFVAAVEFMMDPEFPAHPLAQEVNGAAQVEEAGGDPQDPGSKELFPTAERYSRSAAIKSGSGKCDE
jgi:hypothetical protein